MDLERVLGEVVKGEVARCWMLVRGCVGMWRGDVLDEDADRCRFGRCEAVNEGVKSDDARVVTGDLRRCGW